VQLFKWNKKPVLVFSRTIPEWKLSARPHDKRHHKVFPDELIRSRVNAEAAKILLSGSGIKGCKVVPTTSTSYTVICRTEDVERVFDAFEGRLKSTTAVSKAEANEAQIAIPA